MIESKELEKMIDAINREIDDRYGTGMTNVELYTAAADGRYGSEFICTYSFPRNAIVINYDELCRMYPYMDKESIKAMLSERINNTIKYLIR